MTIAILIHAFVFLVFWLTNLAYLRSLNDFLIGIIGIRVNYLLWFMVFAGLVALWSGLRLVIQKRSHKNGTAWPYFSLGIFFLLFFYVSFIFMFLENSSQLFRLGQGFQYFRIFIDSFLLLLFTWATHRWLCNAGKWKKGAANLVLLILWLVPVFLPPGNVYRGALPDKPLLIAHRGAASLAPENTLASMQTAANLGVYGLETDISTSEDGVLFLMHDNSLARSTDAAQVFPGRKRDAAETFSWDELSRLDAGSWFGDAGEFAGEPIPTLENVLQVVKDRHLYFIYDLRIPAKGHTYADKSLVFCLKDIKTAGIADRAWVLAKPEEISFVRSILPEASLTKGIGYYEKPPSSDLLVTQGYSVVNSVYSIPNGMIHEYQKAGLWVNLWLVDEPWQYSRLWLVGVDSVSSNYVQVFLALTRPVMAIPYAVYLLIWGVLGLLAVGITIFLKK